MQRLFNLDHKEKVKFYITIYMYRYSICYAYVLQKQTSFFIKNTIHMVILTYLFTYINTVLQVKIKNVLIFYREIFKKLMKKR